MIQQALVFGRRAGSDAERIGCRGGKVRGEETVVGRLTAGAVELPLVVRGPFDRLPAHFERGFGRLPGCEHRGLECRGVGFVALFARRGSQHQHRQRQQEYTPIRQGTENFFEKGFHRLFLRVYG